MNVDIKMFSKHGEIMMIVNEQYGYLNVLCNYK